MQAVVVAGRVHLLAKEMSPYEEGGQCRYIHVTIREWKIPQGTYQSKE